MCVKKNCGYSITSPVIANSPGGTVNPWGTACRAASAMMRSSRRPKITPLEMTRASTRKPAIGWANQRS
jgi:hypothetical protein